MRTQLPKVEEDGVEWLRRLGQLWTDYENVAKYIGAPNAGAARGFVHRNNADSNKRPIRQFQHGRNKLSNKADLDVALGLTDADAA